MNKWKSTIKSSHTVKKNKFKSSLNKPQVVVVCDGESLPCIAVFFYLDAPVEHPHKLIFLFCGQSLGIVSSFL